MYASILSILNNNAEQSGKEFNLLVKIVFPFWEQWII